MKLHFYKYHGTGNDFILFDNRNSNILLSQEQIALMCNRHIGIGADGLMLVENADGYDFKMVYYNSDGRESTMCGNGGRCIIAFAKRLGIVADTANFVAIDGPHKAILQGSIISLQMQDVREMHDINGSFILDTGSPHFVKWIDEVEKYPVFVEGRTIRHLDAFMPDGINVNFAQKLDANSIFVRTYERGVENETLSCGTGVTASAIAATDKGIGMYNVTVKTPGGKLSVSFEKTSPTSAQNIVLTGPAVFVFEGEIEIG